jgi:hypothetical protein
LLGYFDIRDPKLPQQYSVGDFWSEVLLSFDPKLDGSKSQRYEIRKLCSLVADSKTQPDIEVLLGLKIVYDDDGNEPIE